MLTFKHRADLNRWRQGAGSQRVRDRISLFNAISEVETGKSAVVTSWARTDRSFHNPDNATDRECVDFRVRHYTPQQRAQVQIRAVEAGLPLVFIHDDDNPAAAHFHCGDLATLATEDA